MRFSVSKAEEYGPLTLYCHWTHDDQLSLSNRPCSTTLEFWRKLEDAQIEFTMRRLPTAD